MFNFIIIFCMLQNVYVYNLPLSIIVPLAGAAASTLVLLTSPYTMPCD